MITRRKTNDPDYKERLRYALSYREKALREAAEAGDETARFAAASHAREAERLLPGIRDEVSRDVARIGEKLQKILAQQDLLVTRVAEGTLRPAKANRFNRKLAARIDLHRRQLAEFNRCLQATSSQDLGGFTDMPLAEYPRTIKKTPPRIRLKPTPAGFALWIGMVALAVLGSLYYLDYFKVVPPVALEVGKNTTNAGAIRVMCRNDSQAPILLYVPGHDPLITPAAGFRGSNRYGLALYVREQDSRDFRLFPVAVSAWTYQGRTLQESVPIEVAPHLYVNLVLDENLALPGLNAEAIRIVLLDSAGKRVVEHQINLHRPPP
ncbi:MAG TPA: hypothetical protein VMZ06_05585 [Candidatus Bathyarchaeia archaeon]|nr:hypothetical protein [Candidatus Bathyarchaeia archaeon]